MSTENTRTQQMKALQESLRVVLNEDEHSVDSQETLTEGRISKDQFNDIKKQVDEAVKEFESSFNTALKTLGGDSIGKERVKRAMVDALMGELDKPKNKKGGSLSVSSAKVKKSVADALKGAVE